MRARPRFRRSNWILTLAEPHASLGMILFLYRLATCTAAESGSLCGPSSSIPNYATAHHWYALDLAAMGRFPQALYEIHQAQKLDPVSLIIGTNVGWIEYLSAGLCCGGHSRPAPGTGNGWRTLCGRAPASAWWRWRTGDYPAAVSDLKAGPAAGPGDQDPVWCRVCLGDALKRESGNREAAAASGFWMALAQSQR